MSLLDYLDERRSLEIGGRRFVVRKPTLGAVVLFSRLFAAEIALAFEKGMEAVPDAPLDRDPRVARVLAAFVEGDGDPLYWPLAELYRVVADISDLPRIAETLRPATDEGGGGSVLNLAKELGVSMVELMTWPYEAVLAARDELRGEATGQPLMMYDTRPGAVFMTADEVN